MTRLAAWLTSLMLVVALAVIAAPAAAGIPEDGQVYVIKNRLTGKCLAHLADDVTVVQKAWNPKLPGMRWRVEKGKLPGVFRLVNVGNGKVLVSPSGSAGDPVVLEGITSEQSPKQMWKFEQRERGITIESRSSSLVLDVAKSDTADGAQVIQFSLNPPASRENQLWEVELAPSK